MANTKKNTTRTATKRTVKRTKTGAPRIATNTVKIQLTIPANVQPKLRAYTKANHLHMGDVFVDGLKQLGVI